MPVQPFPDQETTMKHATPRTVNAVVFLCMALAFLLYANATLANPFSVGTTLYGDPRPLNPDGLEVSVLGDVVGNSVDITVDLAPMAGVHDDVKLHEFYFNLVAPASDYAVTVLDPASWNVKTEADVVGAGQGASATFLFEASGDNASRPTIGSPLVFNIEKLVGDFAQTDFTDALTFNSNDVTLGGGSAGAHLQSLNLVGCAGCDDSGFALGDWSTGGVNPQSVGAPGTIALLSLGLVGLVVARRRG